MTLVPEQDDRDDMAIPSYLHWNPLINWLFWKRLDAVYSFLPDRQLNSIMDYGCGIGSLLPALNQKANRVIGVDKRPQLARELVKIEQLPRTDIYDLTQFNDISDSSLDVITSADVLEHVDDLPWLVQQFRKQLKSDGILIVSGPTENALYRLGRKIAGFSGEYHVRTIEDIDQEILRAGFHKRGLVKLPLQLLPQELSLFHIFSYTCK